MTVDGWSVCLSGCQSVSLSFCSPVHATLSPPPFHPTRTTHRPRAATCHLEAVELDPRRAPHRHQRPTIPPSHPCGGRRRATSNTPLLHAARVHDGGTRPARPHERLSSGQRVSARADATPALGQRDVCWSLCWPALVGRLACAMRCSGSLRPFQKHAEACVDWRSEQRVQAPRRASTAGIIPFSLAGAALKQKHVVVLLHGRGRGPRAALVLLPRLYSALHIC
jgi:hypothetical protein